MHKHDFETEHLIEDYIIDDEEVQLPLLKRIYNYIYPNGYEVCHLVIDSFITLGMILLLL